MTYVWFVLFVLALGAAGYFYWRSEKYESTVKLVPDLQKRVAVALKELADIKAAIVGHHQVWHSSAGFNSTLKDAANEKLWDFVREPDDG
jgi:hypothetical protein